MLKLKIKLMDNNKVYVKCPYCGAIHQHSSTGIKESHCYPGGRYILEF